jgi:predicted acetyltransferase
MNTSQTEYRRLATNDERFHRQIRYAFTPGAGPWDDEARAELNERIEENRFISRANRGLFAEEAENDAEPLAVAGWYDLQTRIREGYHPVGAVTAVATPPEHRRNGYVRELLLKMLVEFQTEGIAFAALWPFKRSFYRDLGWETGSLYDRVSGKPAQFQSAGADQAGEFIAVSPGDWETLAPILAVHERNRALHVERSAEWWEGRIFQQWGGQDNFGYRWDDNRDEPRAYVIYRFNHDDSRDGRTLRVVEAAWTDPEAYRQLLRFVGDHDSQAEMIECSLPHDPAAQILDLVDDPSGLTVETRPGPMVRVVDVVDALSTVRYPGDDSVILSVSDPLRSENDGTFWLDVTGGVGQCESTDGPPDASLPITALSQLVVGFRGAAMLSAQGVLNADSATIASLEELFPAEQTLLREGF